jgi:hypothetical protein
MSEIATVMNRKAEAVPPKIASAFVFFHLPDASCTKPLRPGRPELPERREMNPRQLI